MAALTRSEALEATSEPSAVLAEDSIDAVEIAALERALRDSEAERRAMFDTATCGRAYVDPDTEQLLHGNPKLREMTGWTNDELVELRWPQLLNVADVERNLPELERLRRGQVREIVFQARCLRKDASLIPVRVWAMVVRDESWRPLRMLVTLEEEDAD
ncbi:MAG TPA: PAS domain S-box protein [Candidatus Binatia bacterium]|nr:PAS domain S-box protein [Candidatus Binatia bacterium]